LAARSLLAEGLARAYTLSSDHACASELLASEGIAREARRGIWAEAAYQVRKAALTDELPRRVGTFQLLEGRIANVSVTRSSIYLNFSADRHRGLSAFLKQADRDRLGVFADNPKGLARRWVRVRGWIEHRDGPSIDLSAAGELEILDETESVQDEKPRSK
jgi:endonuclease YncB( thermonuclease family)